MKSIYSMFRSLSVVVVMVSGCMLFPVEGEALTVASPYVLTQISPYEKQKIQGYLDKAWQYYLKKDYDNALLWWRKAANTMLLPPNTTSVFVMSGVPA